jgi:hypothetical protein
MANREIDIEVLRTVINRVLDALIANGVRTVAIDAMDYWYLSEEQRSRWDSPGTADRVGNLSDDYDFLVAAIDDPDPSHLLLEHIAPLLLGITEELRRHS